MLIRCTLATLLFVSVTFAQQPAPRQPADLRRQAEIAKAQAKVEKVQQAYWQDYFWRYDYNRLVHTLNTYSDERARGKIRFDLQRKAQKLWHKVFGSSKHCRKPRK